MESEAEKKPLLIERQQKGNLSVRCLKESHLVKSPGTEADIGSCYNGLQTNTEVLILNEEKHQLLLEDCEQKAA